MIKRAQDGRMIAKFSINCPKCGGGMIAYDRKGKPLPGCTIYAGYTCYKCNEQLYVPPFEDGKLQGQLTEHQKWEDKIFKLFDLHPREDCM